MNNLFTVIAAGTNANRFPRPEFESGYQIPSTAVDAGRAYYWEYVDNSVLILLLVLATWLALRKKSRSGLMVTAVISIIYFGFFRKGCVCSIGSIQNIASVVFNGGPGVSLTIIGFFLLPLVFALWFGRVFCSSVCPFGALQEVVQYKPVRLPPVLTTVLGFIPYIYLALTLMFVATGTTFLICKYDPFISLFRLSASLDYVLYTAAFLLLCMVVARPYCRFLCPYGVLLKWASWFSRYNINNTCGDCVGCRLCEEACTVAAIHPPVEGDIPEKVDKGTARLMKLILMLPVFLILSGWTVSRFDSFFASSHPTVALAREISNTGDTNDPDHTAYWEVRAWRSSGRTKEDILAEAKAVVQQFHQAGWYAGGFLGLVFGLSLIRLSKWRNNIHPATDVPSCVACGRCFIRCPLKQLKRNNLPDHE